MLTVLSVIAVIGILILFHEAGHFIVAKIAGVRVEKFSIGYPPTMIRKKIGDTEYCISWIPFGGYVKLSGEEPIEESEWTPKPYDFNAKSPLTRAIILLFGPLMNLVLGILLIWFVLVVWGRSEPRYDEPRIGNLVMDMPAERCGLLPGDLVLFVDGDTVKSWNDMAEKIHRKLEQPIELIVLRGEQKHNLTISCTTVAQVFQMENGDTTLGVLGIYPPVEEVKIGPVPAIGEALTYCYVVISAIGDFLWRAVTGRARWHDIGGPVMIARLAGKSAKLGMGPLLAFTAALSINLAVLNLLPFPILDGGQLLFVFIEMMRRKPISAKARVITQQISIAFLIALVILVTIKDVFQLF